MSQLLFEQLEFANLIVLNKTDQISAEDRGRIRSMLSRFNPEADIVETSFGKIDPALLFGVARFNMKNAAAHPQWLKEARIGEHKPESEEYGISSFTFRARVPLHPQRLRDAMMHGLKLTEEASPLRALVRMWSCSPWMWSAAILATGQLDAVVRVRGPYLCLCLCLCLWLWLRRETAHGARTHTAHAKSCQATRVAGTAHQAVIARGIRTLRAARLQKEVRQLRRGARLGQPAFCRKKKGERTKARKCQNGRRGSQLRTRQRT